MSFRRDLLGNMVALTTGRDVFRWNLHSNGIFLVKSMYQASIQMDAPINNDGLPKPHAAGRDPVWTHGGDGLH